MASPFPYYSFSGSIISFASPDEFFDYYHMCEHCLVKPMCLKFKEGKFEFDKNGNFKDNVRTQKPCREFLKLL